MSLHDREEWGEAEPPGDMTDKMVYPSRANMVGLMVVTDAGGSGMRLNRVGVVAASLLNPVLFSGGLRCDCFSWKSLQMWSRTVGPCRTDLCGWLLRYRQRAAPGGSRNEEPGGVHPTSVGDRYGSSS